MGNLSQGGQCTFCASAQLGCAKDAITAQSCYTDPTRLYAQGQERGLNVYHPTLDKRRAGADNVRRGLSFPGRNLMETVEIESWEHLLHFAGLADRCEPGMIAYVFRGQSNASWGLQPSLLRCLGEDVAPKVALFLERRAYDQFRSIAHWHLPEGMLPNDVSVMSWWGVMQHYRAPTRLLDWTESIFVALYFAVNDGDDCDGALWAVHAHSVNESMTRRYGECTETTAYLDFAKRFLVPDAPASVFFVGLRRKSDRMFAQRGQFSVSQMVLCDHGEAVNSVSRELKQSGVLVKLMIPAKLKPEFARRLSSMSISAATLFPGIDGLGMSIAEFLRQEGFRTKCVPSLNVDGWPL